jgi:hypothetical protein
VKGQPWCAHCTGAHRTRRKLGGSSTTACATANQHRARLTTRDGFGSLVLPVLAESAIQTTWTSASSFVTYAAPASAGCPGGATFFLQSLGAN